MKKKILGLLVVGALSLGLVGCSGVLENNLASKSGDETKKKYVVINYSGGKIVDLWTLEDFNVQTLIGSIKCEFVDDNGNNIFVLDDVLVIGCKDDNEFSKYEEFHEAIKE
ncbi:putative lipoprotein [Clostridium perfringens D str. JGS1721]|uniref:Putative lipoprotein n=1 Tax=Clostridium perfringens D str. JGS1721 TaxID=488537 RepID=B1V1H3_CLOPF|nr:hypothetical protein [Clostridium perfringens]EDT72347.1 putative lipoprotein [Clostridium perfringens D str. JGS1721]